MTYPLFGVRKKVLSAPFTTDTLPNGKIVQQEFEEDVMVWFAANATEGPAKKAKVTMTKKNMIKNR